MGKMVNKGQLKRWNDRKGFGFIKPDDDQRDIFIHISALKGLSRRPIVGDTIFYDVQNDKDGKTRAINGRIEGVEQVQFDSTKSDNKSGWAVFLLVTVLAAIYGIYYYLYT